MTTTAEAGALADAITNANTNPDNRIGLAGFMQGMAYDIMMGTIIVPSGISTLTARGRMFNAFQNLGAPFYAPLVSTLALTRGTGTPTFTRADATPCATHTDFEGIVRVVPANCARFQGCRVVRNLYAATTTLSTQGVTTVAGPYTVSFTGTGTITFTGTFTGSLVGQGAGVRVASTFTATSGTLTSTVSGSVTSGQLESVLGQTNQNPSEYVSVGVLAAPYQGAGVDGIQFFNTLNGNTVASNVVTSGTGAAIKQGTAGVSATAPVDASGPLGYLAEVSRTNIFLNSDLIGTSLATQSITVTAAPWTVSFTGTGTITFSGAFTGSLVGSGATTRVQQTFTPSAGSLTCTVSGTVQKAQAELGSFASSFIPTVASAVTRNADVLTYPSAGNISGTVGSAYLEAIATNYAGSNGYFGVQNAAGTEAVSMFQVGTALRNSVDAGGVTQATITSGVTTAGTLYKSSMSWALNNVNAAFNGVAGTQDTSATMPDLSAAAITIGGFRSVFMNQPSTTIRNVRIWPTALTSAQLQAITT